MNARLIVLALVVGCFVMGFAADVSAQAASKSSPAGGPREGIKVHGDWVIEVRNPDGTLATRREFKNALSSGGELIASLLTRQSVFGEWAVVLSSASGAGLCSPTDARGNCVVIVFREPDSQFPGDSRTLAIASDGGVVTLTANGTVSRSTNVAFVGTHALLSPSGGGSFTYAVLASPIPVGAGQIIQVTVTISFS